MFHLITSSSLLTTGVERVLLFLFFLVSINSCLDYRYDDEDDEMLYTGEDLSEDVPRWKSLGLNVGMKG